MKKIALTVLSVFAVSLCAAETIKTVNFNPSRFGKYEKLKISEKASFKGGLETNAMTVQASSAGQVNMNSNSNYEVPRLLATKGATVGEIHFPNACFYGNAAGNGCTTGATAAFNSNLDLDVTGGTMSFTASGGESRIQNVLTNPQLLNLKAAKLQMLNARLVVNTPDGASSTKKDYNNADLNGIRLVGVVVPPPGAAWSGTKTLAWQTRRTIMDEASGTYDTYSVLVAK